MDLAARRSDLRWRCQAFLTLSLLLLIGAEPLVAQGTNDPAITRQPASGIAAQGEGFGFSVEATGTGPLTFSWRRNNEPLVSATNRFLTLVNLTNSNAGNYSVVVSNSLGSVTSQVATLTLIGTPRTVLTGTVTGDSKTVVPVFLSANGRESRLVFTLGFNTNVLGNPTFQPMVTNESATFDTNRAGQGVVSGAIQLPAGSMFAPGRQEIGRIEFDLLTGTNPLAAGLFFTNVDLTATNVAFNTNNQALVLGTLVPPQVAPLTLSPGLNRQSGLFDHRVRVGYAGTFNLTNVNVLIRELGNDSRTNAIRVYNAAGVRTVGPDAEGFFEILPFVSAGSLAPAETRDLTLEYYVSDHFTVPSPEYLVETTSPAPVQVPASAIPLNITTNRFVDGTFIIQFPTRRNYRYFVQYGPTLNDVMNSSTNARVVVPGVDGTGHALQWIDNGPPKTISPPVQGSRFYRLLEVPID